MGSIDKTLAYFLVFLKDMCISMFIFYFKLVLSLSKLGYISENASSFECDKNGSEMLIEEFPSNEDFIDTKEKIEKI